MSIGSFSQVEWIAWLLAAVSCAATLFALSRMQAFPRAVPTINTIEDMRSYQRFVRVQMLSSLLIIVLSIALPLVVLSGAAFGADPGWLPFVFQVGPLLLLRKFIRAAETRCRSLPTAPGFERAYTSTTQVWIERALPRFDDIDLNLDAGGSTKMECQTHGRTRGAPCVRCGGFRCIACSQTAGTLSRVCKPCSEQVRETIERLRPAFRATSRAAHAVTALGLADLSIGVMLLGDPLLGNRFGGVLIALGVLTIVAGSLWSYFIETGRYLSLVLALPHLVMLPIGTAVAVMALWVGSRYAAAASPEASEAANLANTVRAMSPILSIVIAGLVLILHGGALISFAMGLSIAFAQ